MKQAKWWVIGVVVVVVLGVMWTKWRVKKEVMRQQGQEGVSGVVQQEEVVQPVKPEMVRPEEAKQEVKSGQLDQELKQVDQELQQIDQDLQGGGEPSLDDVGL